MPRQRCIRARRRREDIFQLQTRRLLLYQVMTFPFDSTASTFERHRSLPTEVPEAIRSAIWSAVGLSAPARVLDIGAGTGRIGRAFVAAGDTYFGVDTSLAMLREFSANSSNCTLTQADGSHLLFPDGSFDIVLLMQVLSGASDWKGIVSEARRVVRSGGGVVVGHTVNPESGIDAQLKRHLKGVLEELKVDLFRPEQSRRRALEWLEVAAVRHVHLIVASWNATATPEAFLQRHRTGAKFAALPAQVQEQALDKLRTWARVTYGSLDTELAETRSFEIDIYEF
jgi:ubiquinone/menaquinone biosynthesis C-methylase UbiE